MGTPSAPERAETLRAALIGAVLAAMLAGPAVLQGQLVGSPGAETLGHAWVQAWAADGWPAWPTGTALTAGASRWPVIDPLPTWLLGAAAHVGRLGSGDGLTLAWNLLPVAGIVLAAVGGARLARAWGGNPGFGAVAVPLMPIFLGSLTSGLTEDALLGLVAFALAFARERRFAAAGFVVGITAWCGLYLAWFAAVGVAAEAVVAIVGGWRGRGTVHWRGLLGGALIAVVLAGGAAIPFASRLGGAPARAASPAVEPLWRLDPWHGADLASFGAPGKVELDGAQVREHPVYLGYATVGLALLGGTPGGWLAVLACAAVAPGDELRFAGASLGVHNPAAAILHALPLGGNFKNHARIMLLGQLVLVAMASRGAARLARRDVRLAAVAGLVVAAEAVWLSPARAPLPGTSLRPPAIYAAIEDLPAALPVRVVGAHNPQQPMFDQRFFRRALRNDPNRPDPGRPHPDDEIVVGFNEAVPRLTEELGPPDAVADGAAAWWPAPT